MQSPFLPTLISACVVLTLSACGGGDASPAGATAATESNAGSSSETAAASVDSPVETAAAGSPDQTTNRISLKPPPAPIPPPPPTVPGAALDDTQRAAAASATAQSTVNLCNGIRPFYWEVGNASAKVASGSLTSPLSTTTYTSTGVLSIASASKWIYGSFVAQKQNGVLSDNDRKFLAMRAGYVNFTSCSSTQTVDSCLAASTNGVYTAADDSKFDYGGGHMQKHASLIGLGALNNKALTSAVQAQLGTDVPLMYSSPQLAGGLAMSADAYAKLLRKIMGGQLKIGALLGSNPFCTNPYSSSCGSSQAVFAPIPPTESWHYSVGHWVEDDPVVGDGAFSSPGAFGFYPWIDASKTSYGIVARMAQNGAFTSVQCGRLIRKAWLTGVAQ